MIVRIWIYAQRYGRGRSAGWRAACPAGCMPAKRIASDADWAYSFFKKEWIFAFWITIK